MVSEDTLNEENLESKEPIMVKMKDIIKEFATIGGVVTEKPIGNGIQLSKLIKQESMDEEETNVSASELTEKLSTFGNYRKTIFGENDLREVAKGLSELAEYAKQYALTEADENFDKITVNRNMKELTGFSKQFSKIAGEAQQLKDRPEAENLLRIYSSLSNQTLDKTLNIFGGKSFSEFKNQLSEILSSKISPISDEIKKLINNQDYLDKILLDGSSKAEEIAGKKIREMKEIIGF